MKIYSMLLVTIAFVVASIIWVALPDEIAKEEKQETLTELVGTIECASQKTIQVYTDMLRSEFRIVQGWNEITISNSDFNKLAREANWPTVNFDNETISVGFCGGAHGDMVLKSTNKRIYINNTDRLAFIDIYNKLH